MSYIFPFINCITSYLFRIADYKIIQRVIKSLQKFFTEGFTFS